MGRKALSIDVKIERLKRQIECLEVQKNKVIEQDIKTHKCQGLIFVSEDGTRTPVAL